MEDEKKRMYKSMFDFFGGICAPGSGYEQLGFPFFNPAEDTPPNANVPVKTHAGSPCISKVFSKGILSTNSQDLSEYKCIVENEIAVVVGNTNVYEIFVSLDEKDDDKVDDFFVDGNWDDQIQYDAKPSSNEFNEEYDGYDSYDEDISEETGNNEMLDTVTSIDVGHGDLSRFVLANNGAAEMFKDAATVTKMVVDQETFCETCFPDYEDTIYVGKPKRCCHAVPLMNGGLVDKISEAIRLFHREYAFVSVVHPHFYLQYSSIYTGLYKFCDGSYVFRFADDYYSDWKKKNPSSENWLKKVGMNGINCNVYLPLHRDANSYMKRRWCVLGTHLIMLRFRNGYSLFVDPHTVRVWQVKNVIEVHYFVQYDNIGKPLFFCTSFAHTINVNGADVFVLPYTSCENGNFGDNGFYQLHNYNSKCTSCKARYAMGRYDSFYGRYFEPKCVELLVNTIRAITKQHKYEFGYMMRMRRVKSCSTEPVWIFRDILWRYMRKMGFYMRDGYIKAKIIYPVQCWCTDHKGKKFYLEK